LAMLQEGDLRAGQGLTRPGLPLFQRRISGHSEHDVDGKPASSAPLKGWSSDHGGTPIAGDKMRITVEELKEIYPQLARDAKAKPPTVSEEQIASYAAYLSEAFQLMRIDTVEAQAA
jgi:hypothetical protein